MGPEHRRPWMQKRSDGDRGATIVEAALVYPLLFLAIFAIVEFGFAFKDWLSVSHAAREGARAGATYGDDPAADMLILRDVEQPEAQMPDSCSRRQHQQRQQTAEQRT